MRTLPATAGLIALCVIATPAEELIWRFDTDGDLEGWTPANFESVEVSSGMLRGVTQYDCMLTSPELNIPADQYTVVEFRASSTVTGSGEVFWHGPGEGFRDDVKRRHVLHASGEPRVYRSRVADVETWEGTIERIRLDLLNPAGARIALDYVRITTEPPGIVPNWSFEDDFDGDRLPDGWTIDAADAAWSAEVALQGDRSLMVEARRRDHEVASVTTTVELDRTGTYRLDAAAARIEGRPRRLSARLRFFDALGRETGQGPATVTKWERTEEGARVFGALETPRLAASAELSLLAESDGARVWWDAVELRHEADPVSACERPLENWSAQWIWATATRGQDDAPACFRRTFELPVAPERIERATAQITADDTYRMWLNEEEIAESADVDGWRTPEIVDLLPHLQAGTNCIAVEAHDVASAEGLLFEAHIVWPGGVLAILSDGSWKATDAGEGGWKDPRFDDGDWPVAEVIAGAGAEPWGPLPYTWFGPRETVALVAAEAPAQIEAGESLTVSATLSKLPSTAADHPVRLSLMQDGGEVLCWAWPVSAVTEKTEQGVAIGPLTVRTSRFFTPGAYQIALGFPRTRYEDQEGIGVAELRIRPPAVAEERPEVSVARHNGIPTLMIDGAPHPFMHYQELEVSRERIGNMAEAGVHLYFLRADDIGWKGPDSYDYSEWDAKITRLLTYDPDALVIPAFTLSGRHQQWWLDPHPDELALTQSGSDLVGIYHHAGRAISLASEAWRQESGEALRRFITHCRSSSYSTRIIGFLPASGVSWEWQHWGSVGDHEPTDYSAPMQAAFRRWVSERYETEEALRAAWQMPEITFETVAIPSVAQRDAADHMLFRDPKTSRYVIDFYRFFQDVMVDGILHYLAIIKDASDGEALAGTYYGYVVTMLGGARRAGDSGHMALSRVLDSELCDFLISPWDYSNRAVGEPTTIMSAVGSVLAHGKLWVMETDLRTHLVEDERQRGYGAPDHLTGTVSQLRRAFASTATKGLALRWYDFSHGWISGDPRQTQVIGQLREIAGRWLEWDRTPDPRGIAVVVDEDTPAAYLSHEIQAMYWLVFKQKRTFEHVGAPWSIYLLDDVVSGRVPGAQAYFFLNCFHMTAEERAALEELKSGGRTLVWLYAPGYIDEDLDASRISELTGMDFGEIGEMRPWAIELDPAHPWAEGIGEGENQQPGIEIGPVFVPDEDGIEVVGRWADGEPGLAVRRFDDWTSVYSAGPILSPTLLKRICREAGVAVRVDGVEPSYVSRNLIGLHAAVPRTETVRFDEPTRVIDLVTGEILAAACTELEVEVPGPGTRLLRTRRAY